LVSSFPYPQLSPPETCRGWRSLIIKVKVDGLPPTSIFVRVHLGIYTVISSPAVGRPNGVLLWWFYVPCFFLSWILLELTSPNFPLGCGHRSGFTSLAVEIPDWSFGKSERVFGCRTNSFLSAVLSLAAVPPRQALL